VSPSGAADPIRPLSQAEDYRTLLSLARLAAQVVTIDNHSHIQIAGQRQPRGDMAGPPIMARRRDLPR
jgi:hypothetical protein